MRTKMHIPYLWPLLPAAELVSLQAVAEEPEGLHLSRASAGEVEEVVDQAC